MKAAGFASDRPPQWHSILRRDLPLRGQRRSCG